MKKLTVLFVAIALLIFFSIPSLLFAETGDKYTFTGNPDGQYQVDITGDGDSDPDTNVFCIDDETYLTSGNSAYTETDEFVSDVLQQDGQGGNFGAGIDEANAEAVEILSTTATGGTPKQNQDAVWDLIEGTTRGDADSQKISEAALNLAQDFLAYNLDNPEDQKTLQEYLDAEKINELKIVLDEKPLVDPGNLETNDFEAEAIMENPLVPGVTDEGKTVFWYIMEGSYNVSFSPTDLVVTAKSIMNDKDDDSSDKDGDGKTVGDNYGYSSIPYYFYWWGEGYPEFEEMMVNLFAWVDIDGDKKLDIQDIKTKDPLDDPDGEVVAGFLADNKVVKIKEDPDNLGKYIIEKTGDFNNDGIPIAEAESLPLEGLDISNQAGGKVLRAQGKYQRFSIQSYTEPQATASQKKAAWGSFEVTKTNSVTGLPVAGATYELIYISGQTYDPDPAVHTLITDANGKASVAHLPWGIYELKEISAPSGYYIDPATYIYHIGGNKLFVEDETNVLDATGNVTNDPIPPVITSGGGEPPVVEVAGISEERAEAADAGVIEVLGISELPFTGSNYVLLLAGIFMVFVAGTVLVVSKKRQANK